ncbi:hypothetical protein EC9_45150 [Rosistilla ulvae]|uniref:Uncharacterized protein n=1 Tax=Rosistilla ulvae TaxID=1930277 RepID=A0A517M614_9BACT|nr:hypothetical protein [Rosistilla ulvae]QDS90308.1 hypothetical protein EC9_45150 [Rosistilla ulvae]
MTSVVRFVCVMLFLTAVIGCGEVRETGQAVQQPPLDAKVTLEKIAATGKLSDQKAQLLGELEGLGENYPPEKTQELLADFEQLSALSDAAAIKAKAQEMAEKL